MKDLVRIAGMGTLFALAWYHEPWYYAIGVVVLALLIVARQR